MTPTKFSAIEVTVAGDNSEIHICRTYILREFEQIDPSPQYVKVILSGAVNSQLPNNYIDGLRNIKTNGNERLTDLMKTVSILVQE